MNKQIVVAGIDVGKFNLDISISSTEEHRRMQNHEDAFATLVEWLREAGVERVVLEPTGRYHRAVSRCLRDAGFAVMEINPLRARRFAEALGRFGKNDRVDAAMLARLGQVMEFEARTPRSHAQTELGNLARGRSRLIHSRTGLSLALAEFQEQPAVVAALEAAIRELDKQTAVLEAAIRRHIGEHAELARRDEILRSIPGVGPVTAALLCAEMPELWLPRPPPGRGAAGRRSAGRRQRNPVRNPPYPGRAGRSPDCPVYGGNQRRHLESGHAGILSAPEGGGKRAQGRDRCGHPKIDCARQRAAQSGSPLAASGADRSREFQHVNNLLINCNDRRARSESGLTADTDAPETLLDRIRRTYDRILAEALAIHEAQPPLAPSKPGKRGRKKRRVGHNLALRLQDCKTETLRFLTDPDVPFTNNEAERDGRMEKLRQKISGGFRSPKGAQDFATLRSAITTARKQGWNIIETLMTSPDQLIGKLQC